MDTSCFGAMSVICPSELRSQIMQKSANCDSNSAKLNHKHTWCRVMLLVIPKTAFTCLWGSGRSSGNASKHSALIYTDMCSRTHLMLSGCCSDVNLAQKALRMTRTSTRPGGMLCDFHPVAKMQPVNPQISLKLSAHVWILNQVISQSQSWGNVGTIIN